MADIHVYCMCMDVLAHTRFSCASSRHLVLLDDRGGTPYTHTVTLLKRPNNGPPTLLSNGVGTPSYGVQTTLPYTLFVYNVYNASSEILLLSDAVGFQDLNGPSISNVGL